MEYWGSEPLTPQLPCSIPCAPLLHHSNTPSLRALAQPRAPVLFPARVAFEGPRQGELAELVADHVLGDEDRHVRAAVVDGDRVADHLREDRRAARPGLQDALLAPRVHLLDAAQQLLVRVRPLLQ